ncbi:class I SAM-dependent methyltransferase [Mesobacterium pallidum]|uniref:class I SAM-dependent methyltransferase n=1 Tax=Mesobacterium pallidum TaxID=2872037 RepID=UPI001EE1A1E0|nr:class I SAM-dependent methyltransferase [Mesobacterium pallidum]
MAFDLPMRAKKSFNERWNGGMGAVDGFDLTFINAIIQRDKPKQVVEIGCASGMSTALMSLMLDSIGGGRIDSYDLAQNYYVDPSKKVGYLVDEIAQQSKTVVDIHRGHTAVDVGESWDPARPIDFCFIDASHQHPWPLIDTLCVMPYVRPGGLLAQHDLMMYIDKTNKLAIGPKMLFDQVPQRDLVTFNSLVDPSKVEGLRTRKFAGNMFAIKRPPQLARIGLALSRGFYLPWSVAQPIPEDVLIRVEAILRRHYPKGVVQAFNDGIERYHGMSGLTLKHGYLPPS